MIKRYCPATVYELGRMEFFFWEPIKRNDIVWNFEKFLVDREGRPRYRFHPGNWDQGRVVEPYLQALIAEDNSSALQEFLNNGSRTFPINVINIALKNLDSFLNRTRQNQVKAPFGQFSRPDQKLETDQNPPPQSGPSLRPPPSVGVPAFGKSSPESEPWPESENPFAEPEPSRG